MPDPKYTSNALSVHSVGIWSLSSVMTLSGSPMALEVVLAFPVCTTRPLTHVELGQDLCEGKGAWQGRGGLEHPV